MKKQVHLRTIKDVATHHNLLGGKENLKFYESELLHLVDIEICRLNACLERSERIRKEQERELNKLKSPELWRFGVITQAPPDYKAEYMRRLAEKN